MRFSSHADEKIYIRNNAGAKTNNLMFFRISHVTFREKNTGHKIKYGAFLTRKLV